MAYDWSNDFPHSLEWILQSAWTNNKDPIEKGPKPKILDFIRELVWL